MTQQPPILSVVLSVYEQARFLPWVLASLRLQDYESSWELLICDDGSSADMLTPVKEFSRTAACEVRYIWQTDCGFRLAQSRNNAVRCARGSVVIFMDGDVLAKPDFLRLHAQAHTQQPGIVCGSRSYIFMKAHAQLDLDCLLTPERVDDLDCYASLPTTPFQKARFKGRNPWYCICGCNFSVSRTSDVFFDEEFVGWGLEDCEFAVRLTTRHGFSLQCLTDNMVYHLEETPPASFHPCRPKSHQEISLYLQNLERLVERYPEHDFRAVRNTALGFQYDAQTETWHSASTALASARPAPTLNQVLVPGKDMTTAIVAAKSSAMRESL